MGKQYSHLSTAQRSLIEVLCHHGVSYSNVARFIGRHRNTVMREHRRGFWSPLARYTAEFGARHYAQGRRNAGLLRRKLGTDLNSPAWQWVRAGLHFHWSPEQICGQARVFDPLFGPLLPGPLSISHETIYRAIYDMPRCHARSALVKLLPQSRSGRRRRSRGKQRFVGLQNITSIDLRPAQVDARLVPGHWEGDLIKGAGGRSCVGTLVERTSRLARLVRLPDATAASSLRGFSSRLADLPPALRRSMTYDRGTEMALHQQLSRRLDMDIFFCDAYSPWQRGTNENTNGLIRRYLPKGTDLSTATDRQLRAIEFILNNRPRKILGFRTAQQVFNQLLAQCTDPTPQPCAV